MKHKTVGKTARWLRRNVKGGLSYDASVRLAINHFRASGPIGNKILKGSKLTKRYQHYEQRNV